MSSILDLLDLDPYRPACTIPLECEVIYDAYCRLIDHNAIMTQPIHVWNNETWFNITMYTGGVLCGLIFVAICFSREMKEPHMKYIMWIYFGVSLQLIAWVSAYRICPGNWSDLFVWTFRLTKVNAQPMAALMLAKASLGLFVLGSELSNAMLICLSVDLVLRFKWPHWNLRPLSYVLTLLSFAFAGTCVAMIFRMREAGTWTTIYFANASTFIIVPALLYVLYKFIRHKINGNAIRITFVRQVLVILVYAVAEQYTLICTTIGVDRHKYDDTPEWYLKALKIIMMLSGYLLFIIRFAEPYFFYVVGYKMYHSLFCCFNKNEGNELTEELTISDERVSKESYIENMQKYNTRDFIETVKFERMDKIMGYKPSVEMIAALLEGINHFNFLPVANSRVEDSSIEHSKILSIATQSKLMKERTTEYKDGDMILRL